MASKRGRQSYGRQCSAFNCNSRDYTYVNGKKGVTEYKFFSFPKEKNLVNQWCDLIKRKNNTDRFVVGKHTVVCNLHFEASMIYRPPGGTKTRLLPGAIPILHEWNGWTASRDCEIKVKGSRRKSCSDKDVLISYAQPAPKPTGSKIVKKPSKRNRSCKKSKVIKQIEDLEKVRAALGQLDLKLGEAEREDENMLNAINEIASTEKKGRKSRRCSYMSVLQKIREGILNIGAQLCQVKVQKENVLKDINSLIEEKSDGIQDNGHKITDEEQDCAELQIEFQNKHCLREVTSHHNYSKAVMEETERTPALHQEPQSAAMPVEGSENRDDIVDHPTLGETNSMEMIYIDSATLDSTGVEYWLMEEGTPGTHALMIPVMIEETSTIDDSSINRTVAIGSDVNMSPNKNRHALEGERRERDAQFPLDGSKSVPSSNSVNAENDSTPQSFYQLRIVPINDLPNVLCSSNDTTGTSSVFSCTDDDDVAVPKEKKKAVSTGDGEEVAIGEHKSIGVNENHTVLSTCHLLVSKESSESMPESGSKLDFVDKGIVASPRKNIEFEDSEFLLSNEMIKDEVGRFDLKRSSNRILGRGKIHGGSGSDITKRRTTKAFIVKDNGSVHEKKVMESNTKMHLDAEISSQSLLAKHNSVYQNKSSLELVNGKRLSSCSEELANGPNAMEGIVEGDSDPVADGNPQLPENALAVDDKRNVLRIGDSISTSYDNVGSSKLVSVNDRSLIRSCEGANQAAAAMKGVTAKRSMHNNDDEKKEGGTLMLNIKMPPRGILECLSIPGANTRCVNRIEQEYTSSTAEVTEKGESAAAIEGTVKEKFMPILSQEYNKQNTIASSEMSCQGLPMGTCLSGSINGRSCTDGLTGYEGNEAVEAVHESTKEKSLTLIGVNSQEPENLLNWWRQVSSKRTLQGVRTTESINDIKTDLKSNDRLRREKKQSRNKTGTGNAKPSSSLVEIEMDRFDKKKPFTCDLCGKGYVKNHRLIQHKRIHAGESKFRCEHCGKQCMKQATLIEHMRIHTGERPFKCSQCDATFSWSSNHRRHEQTHTDGKRNRCVICGKGYTQSWHLKIHMRSHTGERPFQCPKCPRRFPSRAYLRHHMRVHESIKGSCEICGKIFGRRAQEASHMMKHKSVITNKSERPYACEQCGKAFASTSILVAHMRTHTGEKPFACETCGKRFSNGGILSKHRKIHTGVKPYVCQVCGKSFIQKSQIQYHWKVRLGKKDHLVMPETFVPINESPRQTDPVTLLTRNEADPTITNDEADASTTFTDTEPVALP